MAEGEFAQVREYLEAASKLPVTDENRRWTADHEIYYLLADLGVLERDEAFLHQYAPLAEETAVRDNHQLFQASAHRAWGVLHRLTGDFTKAESRLNQALEQFRRMETRWQIGRTLSELAELKLAQSDPDQAKQFYSQALDSFEQIGARPDATRIRQALVSL